jgi:hypothetical protein
LTKALPRLLGEVREMVGERWVAIVFDRGSWSPKLFAPDDQGRLRRADLSQGRVPSHQRAAVEPASRRAMPTLPSINFFARRRKGSISYCARRRLAPTASLGTGKVAGVDGSGRSQMDIMSIWEIATLLREQAQLRSPDNDEGSVLLDLADLLEEEVAELS